MVFTSRVCKLIIPCSPRTLKQWLQCRLDHHPTMDRADLAERAHIPPARIKAYAAESESAQITVPALIRLCAELEDWSAFDLVLAQHGLRLERFEVERVKSLERETLDVVGAVGALTAGIQKALDGGIDVHEVAAIRLAIHHARQQLDELDCALPKEQPVTNPALKCVTGRAS